jgi:hypothetical protein
MTEQRIMRRGKVIEEEWREMARFECARTTMAVGGLRESG